MLVFGGGSGGVILLTFTSGGGGGYSPLCSAACVKDGANRVTFSNNQYYFMYEMNNFDIEYKEKTARRKKYFTFENVYKHGIMG
jgi:hypothetical protein